MDAVEQSIIDNTNSLLADNALVQEVSAAEVALDGKSVDGFTVVFRSKDGGLKSHNYVQKDGETYYVNQGKAYEEPLRDKKRS